MLETLRSRERLVSLVVVAVVAMGLYLSTLQTDISGSRHAYAKDVGEIQNALPRWGLIHRSGYPLYSAMGSLFVNALWRVGIEPSAGASLFSAIWGTVTVVLLSVLAHEMGASWSVSALGGLTVAVSRSVWVDSSLAEVHTLTLFLSVATLLFAVRFRRAGKRRDLLLLTLFFTQGVAHQRSVVLLAPGIAILMWPNVTTSWRNAGSVIGVALLAPLTYLYMPLRVWTGADWVFGSPGTWDGFWAMVLDNRADRVFRWSAGLEPWLTRGRITLQIIADDMWWPVVVVGLAGLLLLGFRDRRWREALALTLAWVPNVGLTLLIWRGRVRDAQLAAKLPVILMAGVGSALVISWLKRRWRMVGVVASVVLLSALSVWGWRVRPFVLSITRDDSGEAVIAKAEQVAPPPDGEPATLALPWGPDYWAVAYAKCCGSQLPGLGVVDHNASFLDIVKRGDHLLVLDETLYVFPLPWWEDRLGPLYISSAAPDVVEISPTPLVDTAAVPEDIAFDLGNGIQVRSMTTKQPNADEFVLSIYWEATEPVRENYRTAVHLVAEDPPRDSTDVLAQADSPHPVGGWYPTSQWDAGDVVRDDYLLNAPPDTSPVAVRVAMYQVGEDGSFDSTTWLSRPVSGSSTR